MTATERSPWARPEPTPISDPQHPEAELDDTIPLPAYRPERLG
ncbi:hypothetical protein [Leucobacter sp. gxy201]